MVDRVPAAQRGRLVMSARVVQKIASQAAGEVSVAGGRSGGLMGIGARTDLAARPPVDVHLSGGVAAISVRVGISYPTSLRQATSDVRRHVMQRVQELTGIDVRRVDVDVAWLTTDNDHGAGAPR